MADVSETALLGGHHPLHDEIGALAFAVASPENMDEIRAARKALLAQSNEHVLLDVAGIIAFFATITTVVDFGGHFSPGLINTLNKIAKVISGARVARQRVRRVMCCSSV